MSRRVMLIASGGLMLGVAGAIGCANQKLAAATMDETPTPSGGRPTVGRSPQPGQTGTGTGTGAAPAPRHQGRASPPDRASHPHNTPTATDGPAPPQPVFYVDDGPKAIALTIDDGPSPIYTPQILQILEKYHITASFSMVGENVTYYPGVAREVADAGHLIVNHTWDHANLSTLSRSKTRAEIGNATDAIHNAVGRRPDHLPRALRRLVAHDARVLRERAPDAARLVGRPPGLGPAGGQQDRRQHHEEHRDRLDHPRARRRRRPVADGGRA